MIRSANANHVGITLRPEVKVKIIHPLDSQVKILNIGCGKDMYGTERIDQFPTSATTRCYDLEHGLPYHNETFDEVFSKNFLEHISNVGYHVKEMFRVLKHGGKAVVITDNAACLKYYTLGTHTGGYSKHEGQDIHFGLFTKEHLKNHFERARFRIISIEYVDTDYFTKWFDRLVRHIIPSLSYPRLRVEAMKD